MKRSVQIAEYNGPATLIDANGSRVAVTVALILSEDRIRVGTQEVAGLRWWGGRPTSKPDPFGWQNYRRVELPNGRVGEVIFGNGVLTGSGEPPFDVRPPPGSTRTAPIGSRRGSR
jgi:hypothetical protein